MRAKQQGFIAHIQTLLLQKISKEWFISRTLTSGHFIMLGSRNRATSLTGVICIYRQSKLQKGETMRYLEMMTKDFLNDESGQDLIEYALVAALVGLASVAALRPVGDAIASIFNTITTTLTGAV